MTSTRVDLNPRDVLARHQLDHKSSALGRTLPQSKQNLLVQEILGISLHPGITHKHLYTYTGNLFLLGKRQLDFFFILLMCAYLLALAEHVQ